MILLLKKKSRESFYRKLDNREDYIKFSNQTRNPIEVVDEEEPDFLEDNLPELYDPETEKK